MKPGEQGSVTEVMPVGVKQISYLLISVPLSTPPLHHTQAETPANAKMLNQIHEGLRFLCAMSCVEAIINSVIFSYTYMNMHKSKVLVGS